MGVRTQECGTACRQNGNGHIQEAWCDTYRVNLCLYRKMVLPSCDGRFMRPNGDYIHSSTHDYENTHDTAYSAKKRIVRVVYACYT